MAFNLGDALKGVSYKGTGREQIEYIRLNQIQEDPNNFYKLSDVEKLADNIQLCGLQQPLRVRPIEGSNQYVIVSGHRRRKAVELLAQDDPERWLDVPCIVEDDTVSPALQQLRLIFANANTRTMTASEISEQAEQVKSLLYKLKEEEGYEFPGRMRDHVAEVVGVSKSKLARLKVIRDDLAAVWRPAWEDGTLAESTAYELAKMPLAYQTILFEEKQRTKAALKYLYADDVKKFSERADAISHLTCGDCLSGCENAEAKIRKAAVSERWGPFHCDNKCCKDCPELSRCSRSCPELKSIVQKLKADARAEAKAEAARIEERDRPTLDFVKLVYERVGAARKTAGVSVADLMGAQRKMYAASVDQKMQESLERGKAKFTVNTQLPFGYSFYPSNAMALCRVADLLGCSIDFLLGRTEVMQIACESNSDTNESADDMPKPHTIWHPIYEEPPVGEVLVWIDKDGYADTGKYLGGFQIQRGCSVFYDEALFWAYKPEV